MLDCWLDSPHKNPALCFERKTLSKVPIPDSVVFVVRDNNGILGETWAKRIHLILSGESSVCLLCSESYISMHVLLLWVPKVEKSYVMESLDLVDGGCYLMCTVKKIGKEKHLMLKNGLWGIREQMFVSFDSLHSVTLVNILHHRLLCRQMVLKGNKKPRNVDRELCGI